MFNKSDVMCIEKTCVGPFWEEYLIFLEIERKYRGLKNLRVMRKKKIIEYKEEALVQYEYHVRTSIRHPFLINFVAGFQDYEHLFLLTEQSQNRLSFLLEKEKKFSLKVARFYIAEMISVIQYLHSKDLTYGFLSPNNVMISDDGHIKLKFEFLNGIDYVVGELDKNIEYASLDYHPDNIWKPSTDYWSLGIFLYQMLVGVTPFSASTPQKIMERMANESIVYPIDMEPSAKSLISALLTFSPNSRLGSRKEDAELVKKHPFFKSINWDDIESKKLTPPYIFNITRKIELTKAARLGALYTTDYLPNQKDGYGNIFGYYGSASAPNPYFETEHNIDEC